MTKGRYSNAGYRVLAAIIERVSRQPYDTYLADHVFRPAGMRETGVLQHHAHPARLAHGYTSERDIGTMLDKPLDADGHLWRLRGNCGERSTLADMHRFYRALLDSTLLRREEHRRAVFPTDGPTILAGSDLTSFFLFASYPREETQIFMAATTASRRPIASSGICSRFWASSGRRRIARGERQDRDSRRFRRPGPGPPPAGAHRLASIRTLTSAHVIRRLVHVEVRTGGAACLSAASKASAAIAVTEPGG